MHPFEINPEVRARIRVLQTIALALISGVIVFGLIVAMLVSQGGLPAAPAPGSVPPARTWPQYSIDVMRLVAAVLLLGAIVGSTLLAVVLPRKFRLQPAAAHGSAAGSLEAQLLGRFFVSRIAALALFEGAAIFGIILALMYRHMEDFTFAGVALLGMLAQFPTTGKYRRFIEASTELEPGQLG